MKSASISPPAYPSSGRPKPSWAKECVKCSSGIQSLEKSVAALETTMTVSSPPPQALRTSIEASARVGVSKEGECPGAVMRFDPAQIRFASCDQLKQYSYLSATSGAAPIDPDSHPGECLGAVMRFDPAQIRFASCDQLEQYSYLSANSDNISVESASDPKEISAAEKNSLCHEAALRCANGSKLPQLLSMHGCWKRICDVDAPSRRGTSHQSVTNLLTEVCNIKRKFLKAEGRRVSLKNRSGERYFDGGLHRCRTSGSHVRFRRGTQHRQPELMPICECVEVTGEELD